MGDKIHVGNAPCSWGVVSGVEGEGYGWRQVLDEIAEAGYAGSELGDWGFMPDVPSLVSEALAARGLSMIGAFTPVRLSDRSAHKEATAIALRTARLLAAIHNELPPAERINGLPFVVLADNPGEHSDRRKVAGRIKPEHGLDDDTWGALAEGAGQIARAVLDTTGLRTVWHHHCATYVETPAETARLMEMTTADLLGLCFDTGHWYYAGGDAVEAVRAYGERIWLVHFKDCDVAMVSRAKAEGWDYITAIRNGIFCGLGEGAIEHAAIASELQRLGYEGWIVAENEAPPGRMPALRMAKQDRAYFAGLGL